MLTGHKMSEKTMDALADILRENGIDVKQVLDRPSAPRRVIVYSGDKDDGFRAIGIASDNGYLVHRLECLWMIGFGKAAPTWKMIFSGRDFKA